MALAAVFVLAVLVLVGLVIQRARVKRPLELRPARPRPSHATPTGRLARGSRPPYPADEDPTEPLPMVYADTDEMKTEEPSTVIIDHDQLYG